MLLDKLSFLTDSAKNRSNLKIISSLITSGNLSHAYLFHGNSTDFLTEIALCFAASINCEEKGCGKCKVCVNTIKGIFENLKIIESEGNILTIDKISELQRFMSISSHCPGTKFCIIREADLMNKEAANRLLKTLEEPPDNKSTFILITEDLPAILPTISSRCIVFDWDFKNSCNSKVNIDSSDLQSLIDKGIKEIIEFEGNFSALLDLSVKIIDLLKQQVAEDDSTIRQEVLKFKDTGATAPEIRKFEESLRIKNRRKYNKYYSLGMNIVFDIITAWLEDIISVRLGATDGSLNFPENYDFIKKHTFNIKNSDILDLIGTIEKNRNYLKYSTYEELVLDNIFLQLQSLVTGQVNFDLVS